MEQESGMPLIVEALEFFNLSENFSLEELNKRFHEMVKKYHPDSGEFSSPEVFFKIVEYRDILKPHSSEEKEDDYSLYKKAKKAESAAILEYYKTTEGNKIFLNPEDNPALRKLRIELEKVVRMYDDLFRKFPDSIWIHDAKTSVGKISVWLK